MWLTALLILLVVAMAAAYKSRTTSITSGLAGVNEFYDFINANKGTPFDTAASGSGASVSGTSLTSRSTLILLNTPTFGAAQDALVATTGYAVVMATGEVLTLATDMALAGTPAGAPDSKFKFGAGGTAFSGTGTAETYFLADRSVSNNWIAVRTNSAGTTQSITTIPIDIGSDPTAPTFHRLKIISNISRSLYYIDAVLVATIDTRAWTNGDHLGFAAKLTTANNPDMESAYIDYISVYFQLATPRQNP